MRAELTLSGETFIIARANDETGDVYLQMEDHNVEPIHISQTEAKLLGQAILAASEKDPMT